MMADDVCMYECMYECMYYQSLQGRTTPTNDAINFAVGKEIKHETRRKMQG